MGKCRSERLSRRRAQAKHIVRVRFNNPLYTPDMSGDAVNSLRDEILERIKQMHDIQRWKLIACAAVVAYFLFVRFDRRIA